MEKDQIVRNSEQLQLTLNTVGWKEIIQPLVAKMIRDCTGYEADGRWFAGEMQRHPERATELSHYTRGLIELNQYIYDHITLAQKIKAEDRIEQIKDNKDVMPMKDTRYS